MNQNENNEKLQDYVKVLFNKFHNENAYDIQSAVGRILYELQSKTMDNNEARKAVYATLIDLVSSLNGNSKEKKELLKLLKDNMPR